VVADALAGGADALGRGLSKKLRSAATVSFSNARQPNHAQKRTFTISPTDNRLCLQKYLSQST
jgi:hypothetical protein